MSHIRRYINGPNAGWKITALPQNLCRQADVLLEDFETIGDWTAGSGSAAANTSEFKTGTQSIKLTTPAGGTGQMTKTINLSGIDYEFFGFWFYLHDATRSHYTSIKFYISSTTDFSKSFNYTVGVTAATLVAWSASNWMLFRIPLSLMTNTGSESWSNTMIRVRFEVVSSSGVVDVSFDDLVGGYKRIPVIAFRHDGPYASLFTNMAFAKNNSTGIRGDMFVKSIAQMMGVSGFMTESQLSTLYNSGWCIGNYGQETYPTNLGMGDQSEAEQEAMVGYGQIYIENYLKLNGSSRNFVFTGSGTIANNANSDIALANAGALTAIGGYGALSSSTKRSAYFPPGNLYNIEFRVIGATTLAAAIADLQDVINRGQCVIYNLDALDAGGMTTSNYIAWLEFIYRKWRSGQIFPITMDEFYNLTLNPTKVGGRGSYKNSASTWTPPTEVFNITHEANNLNEWSYKEDTGNYLSSSAAAAMKGTSYGLNINFPGTTTTKRYVQKYFIMPDITDATFRIYYDPNTFTVSSYPYIFYIKSTVSNYFAARFYIGFSTPNYTLRFYTQNDSGSTTNGTAFNITDEAHYVDIALHQASGVGVSDGWAKIYVDGTLKDTLSNIANYNLFRSLNLLQIGPAVVGAGDIGDIYFDEIVMHRGATLVGA